MRLLCSAMAGGPDASPKDEFGCPTCRRYTWVFAFAIAIPAKSTVDISLIHDPAYGGKLDASTGPPPLRNAVMTRIVRAGPTALLPCFRVQVLQHGIA